MPSEMAQVPLSKGFYDREPDAVARDILGKILVRQSLGGVASGRIVETEAYLAEGDPACHASRGRTQKNASMFGTHGRAYVYAIHSRWCVNVVTEPRGTASAVLIRAIEPLTGIPLMQRRRNRQKLTDLTRGPGRLCAALDIDRRLDGWSLTVGRRLWITDDESFTLSESAIGCSPRIGVTSAEQLPLRFYLRNHPHVSGTKRLRA